MDWTMLGAVATAMGVLVTAAYTFLFLWAIRYAARQVKEMAKAREIQVLLDIFRELKTEKFMDERGYIYEKFPESIEGVDSLQLKAHLQALNYETPNHPFFRSNRKLLTAREFFVSSKLSHVKHLFYENL